MDHLNKPRGSHHGSLCSTLLFKDTIKLGYIHGVTHQNLVCHFLQCAFATKVKKINDFWSVLRLFNNSALTDQDECFNPKSVHVPWTTSTNLADLTMRASVLRFSFLQTASYLTRISRAEDKGTKFLFKRPQLITQERCEEHSPHPNQNEVSFHHSTPPPTVTTQYSSTSTTANRFWATEHVCSIAQTACSRRDAPGQLRYSRTRQMIHCVEEVHNLPLPLYESTEANYVKWKDYEQLCTLCSHIKTLFWHTLSYTIFFTKFQLHLYKTEPLNIPSASPLDTYSSHNAEMNSFCAYKRTTKNWLGIRQLKILVAHNNHWGQQGVRRRGVGDLSLQKRGQFFLSYSYNKTNQMH